MCGKLNEGLWPEPAKVVLTKKFKKWTQQHKHTAFAWVVNGARTRKRQQEMDWVSSDRCLQCGEEGQAYHRLYDFLF